MGAADEKTGLTDGGSPDGEHDAEGGRSRRTPTQPRALATFEKIVAAAAELGTQQSLRSLAVVDVTEAAGVSKGAFYGYFNGIDELVDEVRSRIRVEYLSYLEAFFASGNFSNSYEALRGFTDWYADFFRSNHIARLMFLERGKDVGLDPFEGSDWAARRPWRAVLGYLDDAGMLDRPVDRKMEMRAEAMYAQFEVLLDMAFRNDPQGDSDVLALLDEMLIFQAPLL